LPTQRSPVPQRHLKRCPPFVKAFFAFFATGGSRWSAHGRSVPPCLRSARPACRIFPAPPWKKRRRWSF